MKIYSILIFLFFLMNNSYSQTWKNFLKNQQKVCESVGSLEAENLCLHTAISLVLQGDFSNQGAEAKVRNCISKNTHHGGSMVKFVDMVQCIETIIQAHGNSQDRDNARYCNSQSPGKSNEALNQRSKCYRTLY